MCYIKTQNSYFSLPSHLDADKVNRNDGFLQWGQAGLIQRLSHHHFGCDIDEVHTDRFRDKREGAWCTQITLNHLKGVKNNQKTNTFNADPLIVNGHIYFAHGQIVYAHISCFCSVAIKSKLKATLIKISIQVCKLFNTRWFREWIAFNATRCENTDISYSHTLREYYLPWHHCL